MRQIRLPLTALLLTLVPGTGFTQQLADRGPLIVWGAIERLYSSQRVLVRTDDDKLYSARASGATIELTGGDLGRWDDLRIGQQVDVFGTVRDDRSVDASHIRITGGRPTDRLDRGSVEDRDRYAPPRYDRYREVPYRPTGTTVEVLGTVS